MTNMEIYNAALRLASEVASEDENGDYLERSGYLLPVACSMCAAADRLYRSAYGLSEQSLPESTLYSMTATFPLSPVFATPVSARLASLLTVQESPELSAALASVSEDALSRILSSLPFRSEKIVDRYSEE